MPPARASGARREAAPLDTPVSNIIIRHVRKRFLQALLACWEGQSVGTRRGVLTGTVREPWPMNDRIKELTGVDVTRTVCGLGGGALPESLR